MRKLTTLTIIGALALSACTTERIVERAPETSSRPAPAPAPQDPSGDFLAYVNQTAGDAIYWSDDDLLEVGLLVCEALDSGATMREVAQTMEDSAVTNGDVELFATVMYAAVINLCPQYEQALMAYINSI
jgi:hypothetical protein